MEKAVVHICRQRAVKSVLAQLSGDKWLMALVMSGSGSRLMECQRLRVPDIDFSRNEILVRDGEGAKDRITMLAATHSDIRLLPICLRPGMTSELSRS